MVFGAGGVLPHLVVLFPSYFKGTQHACRLDLPLPNFLRTFFIYDESALVHWTLYVCLLRRRVLSVRNKN